MENKARAARQYFSKSVSLAAANDPFSLQYKVPQGYTRLSEVIFDPDKDVTVNLNSEMLGNTLILSGFSTKIGSAMGIINPGVDNVQGDTLTASGNIRTAAAFPALFTLTLVFE